MGNNGGPNIKVFTYNVVFEPGATQDDILQYSGVKRLIEMAIEGFSCTAFCYGQTGSGKTHTLTGPPGLVSVNLITVIYKNCKFIKVSNINYFSFMENQIQKMNAMD